jgi:hypothetical protein
VQEIEGEEHDPVRRLVNGRAQGIEVGDAILVLDDDLAIKNGGLAGELAGSFDNSAIWSRPVPAMSGQGFNLVLVDDHQGAVAVLLDLVNPGWRSGTSVGISGLIKPTGGVEESRAKWVCRSERNMSHIRHTSPNR